MNVMGDNVLPDAAFASEQYFRIALCGVLGLLDEIDRDFVSRDRLDATSICSCDCDGSHI